MIPLRIDNSGTLTVVAEGKDGKYYVDRLTTDVGYPYASSNKETKEPLAIASLEEREVPMRIKAKEISSLVKVKAEVNSLERFIVHITATVSNKVVYDVATSRYISEGLSKTRIGFQFTGEKDDILKIKYIFSDGTTIYSTAKIR